jgi:hypothetical protein
MWGKLRVLLVVSVVVTFLAGAVGQAGALRQPAGQVSPTIDSTVPSGRSFGATLNKGTLTLIDGTRHVFAVSGLGVQGPEGSTVDLVGKGEVYQLQKLEDFAGTYRRAIGELSPERDTNTVIIENQHGVVMAVTVTVDRAKGNVRLVPSESDVTVTIER